MLSEEQLREWERVARNYAPPQSPQCFLSIDEADAYYEAREVLADAAYSAIPQLADEVRRLRAELNRRQVHITLDGPIEGNPMSLDEIADAALRGEFSCDTANRMIRTLARVLSAAGVGVAFDVKESQQEVNHAE